MSRVYIYKKNWRGIILCMIVSSVTNFALTYFIWYRFLLYPYSSIVAFISAVGMTFGYVALFEIYDGFDTPVEVLRVEQA